MRQAIIDINDGLFIEICMRHLVQYQGTSIGIWKLNVINEYNLTILENPRYIAMLKSAYCLRHFII